MRWTAATGLPLAIALAACGSGSGHADAGPPATIPASGTFEWTAGGQTIVAPATMSGGIYLASYDVAASPDGTTFVFEVSGQSAGGETCTLSGSFAYLVPPLPGTYSVVAAAQSRMEGVFSSTCSDLDATGGKVVLVVSDVGDVEGTFQLRGPPGSAGGSPSTIAGGFNVGCVTGAGARCGPYTSPGGGTCAGLAACCGTSADCMQLYASSMPNGDAACARVLLASGPMFCP